MVGDEDHIATHALPEVIATGELIYAKLDQLVPLRYHKLMVPRYLSVTQWWSFRAPF